MLHDKAGNARYMGKKGFSTLADFATILRERTPAGVFSLFLTYISEL